MVFMRKWICSFLLILVSSNLVADPITGKQGMVVSAQHYATQVGQEILQQGGNAVDAAVAVGYALAVAHPCCGNLGGGGFMMLRLADGSVKTINFREKAPAALTQAHFLDEEGELDRQKVMRSFLGGGVPGTVLGLNTALENYGTMTLEQVMAPAIKLAQEGYILVEQDAANYHRAKEEFSKEENTAKTFLKEGETYQIGERLKQSELAQTLTLISKSGSDAFYHGEIAKKMVEAIQAKGGVMTEQDLADYTVTQYEPIECEYRGYRIYSTPPPSSGGIALCQMLSLMEAYPLDELGKNNPKTVHYQIEAMRHAFADRNEFLGDPEFVENPAQRLLAESYITNVRDKIEKEQAGDSSQLGLLSHDKESAETTHYTVADEAGNVVAVTYTVNGYFGSHLIPGDLGFFINNTLDDFTLMPGKANFFGLVEGEENSLEPGKRPLSAMSPTIVTKDGEFFLALGSPGGPTIISSILQVLQNIIDFRLSPQEAVEAPRFHMQWLPDQTFMEEGALSDKLIAALEEKGHKFQMGSPYQTPHIGAVGVVLYDAENQNYYGAQDSRRPAGLALGY